MAVHKFDLKNAVKDEESENGTLLSTLMSNVRTVTIATSE